MQTAAYARYSSDKQRETSLEDQVRVCREFMARHDGWTWQDAHVYIDAGISGASIDGRPGLQALLAAAARRPRPFDVVLVDDSSRVARDLADALRVLQQLRFEGVRVIYISQGIDSASEQAETLVAVHGLVDGLYTREMAAKIRRGIQGQLERGYSTGAVHYGYRAVPDIDPSGRLDPNGHPALLGKRPEVVSEEAAVIRRIFTWYAEGTGVPTIVERLNAEGTPGARGATWKSGAVGRLLKNERLLGRQVYGQTRTERRPGTNKKVAKEVPRSEWRIVEVPALRIISEDLWQAVQTRRAVVATAARQAGSALMRGATGALHSRHLFTGFMRCGVCHGAVTVVSGGFGTPRYGCQRHSKNGRHACENRLTVRAKIADAALLEGLRAELLTPDVVAYVVDQLAAALNALSEARPEERATLERTRAQAEQKLGHLVAAVEAGQGTATVFAAIKAREGELRTLEGQLAALAEPLEERLAVMPPWVQSQLADVANLLQDVPERVKAHFQTLDLRFVLHPTERADGRKFLRAEGAGNFARLAFAASTPLYRPDRSLDTRRLTAFAPVFAAFQEQNAHAPTADRLLPR